MVIPLMKQAADGQGTDEQVTRRYSVAWADGAARAADARLALRAFLAPALLPGRTPVPVPLALDAELAVSELVTNALRHAPGPCGLVLRLSREELEVTVWDTSAEVPAMRQGDRQRVGGHGLRLVHAVSDRVVVAPSPSGKQITACLRLAPDASGTPAGRTVLPASLSGGTTPTH
jgi:anti-sigma regulatory factor (Ser/Thr protein kinase)